ncbi:MAG: STAS domain-containing protein [Bacteroidales bacterium]|jgi:SulP family sulfate permease|nr:STAS domain-containing protein [Bacteroidales bacterium]
MIHFRLSEICRPALFSVLKQGYGKEQFGKDLFSGIIVGIVALPLAIAFAVASGVSPEKGLITAVIAGFIISFLGGSRVQIGGPTGAFIVIVFGVLQQYGFDGLLISTILAGFFLILFGLLKLGTLLRYIPHPLIVGFTSAIALVIFSTQVKDALGLQIRSVPGDFIGKWTAYIGALGTTNKFAVVLTIITIFITVGFKKITTKIPGSFVAIILVTLFVHLFHVPVNTIETSFGTIPQKISLSAPHIDWAQLQMYFAPALTIALLGAIESLLSAVVADGMIGSTHDSNTELIAQGVANVVTPFFGGIPATGAIARTATNVKNGGRTPIAGMMHAVTLLLIMLFFGSWAKLIPMPCLAGILIVVAYNMSEWRSFLSIFNGSRFDILILLVTFFLTVFIDLTVAIEVGVVLSALLFMKRMSDAGGLQTDTVDRNTLENYSDIPAGISIYEISGPFFFGSAKSYCNTLREIGSKSKVLIVRMRYVPFVDQTAVHNLRDVIQSLQKSNIKVILSGVNPKVYEELHDSRIVFLLGKANILSTFEEAVQRAKKFVN